MGKVLDIYHLIKSCLGFDWDEGNEVKNWSSHHVSQVECEAIFLNAPIIKFDRGHSQAERRFLAKGKTDEGRYLFVAFTVRKKQIRIISARDMSEKELQEYKENEKTNP